MQEQRVVARRRCGGELLRRLGVDQVGAALGRLSGQVGGVEFGQQLAFLHSRADIEIPFLHIAVRLGIDRRAGVGLHIARQAERPAPAFAG